VTDDGCGMDEETLSHVFEPFYTTKEQGKGTGLGLSTVYAAIQQGGGHVQARSDQGHGTTFEVFLPLCPERPDEDETRAGGELAAARRASSEKILLVEDEESVRSLVRHALEKAGYTVLVAANGPEALELEREHQASIELLLTDLVMPRMGGRELAEELARRRPGLRVLLMSGYTDDAVVRNGGLEAGTEFLQKPFSLGTLVSMVRRVLDAPARTVASPRRAGPGPVAPGTGACDSPDPA